MFLLILLFFGTASAITENILLTEVFKIEINPALFNWTYEGNPHQYVYHASLLDHPDLPSWIKYVYSEKNHMGFLYGVAPVNYRYDKVSLQIVGLNKKTYDTKTEYIDIYISKKLNPAKYEVHIKIDNLNVNDIFDIDRMDRLKDIFGKYLWQNSINDIYVTYLESAIELGARKPLNPEQGEGIVLRLGSESQFSVNLKNLEDEVRPLWKMPQCPRNFKRTSVERYFRDAGFTLDWCAFRLIDSSSNSAMRQSEYLDVANDLPVAEYIKEFFGKWDIVSKDELPERRYGTDMTVSVVLPIVLLLVLVFILSFILCFYHDDINKELDEMSRGEPIENSIHTTITSADIQKVKLSPDPLISKSHSESPNATITRGMHCRPSPPPYVRPKYKPDL